MSCENCARQAERISFLEHALKDIATESGPYANAILKARIALKASQGEAARQDPLHKTDYVAVSEPKTDLSPGTYQSAQDTCPVCRQPEYRDEHGMAQSFTRAEVINELERNGYTSRKTCPRCGGWEVTSNASRETQ